MARVLRCLAACLLATFLVGSLGGARVVAATKTQRKAPVTMGAHSHATGKPSGKATTKAVNKSPTKATSKPAPGRSPARSGPGAATSSASAAGTARASDVAPTKAGAPSLEGKIAVFPFTGEGEGDEGGASSEAQGTLRRPVLALLRGKGLTPLTDLRTVDMPDQFRDMATALNLIAYVHGKVQSQRDKRRLTLFVRSGFSGRKGAALVTTVPAEGWNDELEQKLWKRLLPLVQRACADAKRPRPRSRTMEINAGTPLEPSSPDDISG